MMDVSIASAIQGTLGQKYFSAGQTQHDVEGWIEAEPQDGMRGVKDMLVPLREVKRSEN